MTKRKETAAEPDKGKENTPLERADHKLENKVHECPPPAGVLIAIGGRESKGPTMETGSTFEENKNFEEYAILQRFVEELKGANPLIVVIPTASEEPQETAADYIKAFKHLKNTNVEIADIRNREDACRPEYLEMIRKAKGIMFTGGSQLRLTAIFGGTKFLDILKDRYTNDPVVIAGTSAGAMALSTPMLYQGGANDSGFLKGELYIATGLEFLKDVAIDTHFIARGRIARMAHLVSMNPGAIGIGLEEDTAIVVKNGYEAEVIGSGLATIVDGHGCTFTNVHEIENGVPVSVCDLRVHFLGKGQSYLIHKRPQTYK